MNFKTRFEGEDEHKKIAMIRLVEGDENVYEKKQDANATQRSFRTGQVNTIVNGKRYYQTEINDKAVENFLERTSFWKRGMITVYNPVEENKKKSAAITENLMLILEIAKWETDNLFKYGYALFGNKVNKFLKDQDTEGLRIKIMAIAQDEPEKIIALKSEDNENKLVASLAFAKGIVIETNAGNSIAWGDTGAQITTVTKGQSPLDAIVEHFNERSGKEVLQLIGAKIERVAKDKVAEDLTAAANEDTDEDDFDDEDDFNEEESETQEPEEAANDVPITPIAPKPALPRKPSPLNKGGRGRGRKK
ncbi:MAG: hypothetical protein LBE36_13580 [Flavobacteriaceae bacterium]|nr:hypothetical protein [Flavobacteriaceae bacterium]